MPTITNPGTIKALITAYLLNDRDQSKAGIEIGYSENYVLNGDYSKLFDRADVLAELDKQEVELIRKTGYSVEQAQYEYEQVRCGSMVVKQYPAANQAILGKSRLHGFDKDNNARESTVIIINPPKQRTKVESEVVENE